MKLGRHSKPSNNVPTQRKSKAQANIAGYERRLARKAKNSVHATDLYEHIAEKTPHSKVADVGRDEQFEFPNAQDGADNEEREELRARLIGENEDDEEIDRDDDEEVDSDAAFEESDEERFAGFFSHKVCNIFLGLETSLTIIRMRREKRRKRRKRMEMMMSSSTSLMFVTREIRKLWTN